MARTETVFKMTIDDGQSVKTLKDLDKNSTKLKKSMDNLADSGDELTDEFKSVNKAYEETIDTQKKLMGDMEHLGEDIIVEVSGSISKMEDRLYELALSGDTVSKEFVDLQQKTAQYKKIVIETDRSIDALAEQGRGLSAALSISSGAVAGFQAFTGVTALMGTENEELLETITKLQAAQGILNSIEVIKQQLQNNSIVLTRARTKFQKLYNIAIGNGTKAMKLFRGALLATGIGAIIIAVGLLIANFDKLKDMLSGVSDAQKLSNEITNKAVDAYAKEANAADQLKKTLNDTNKTREEKVIAVQKLQAEYPSLLANIDAERAGEEEINRALDRSIKLMRLRAEIQAAEELRAEKFKEKIQENIDASTGQNVDFWDSLTTIMPTAQRVQDTANENSIETIKNINKQIDGVDKLIDKKKEQLKVEESIGSASGAGAFLGRKPIEDEPKPTGGSGKSAGQTRAEEEAKALLELSLLQEELRRMTLTALELEELAITDKFDNLSERAGDHAATLKNINEQQAIELTALFKKRKDAEKAIQDAKDNTEEARLNEFLDRKAKAEEDATTTKQQKEINAVREKYFELITLAEQYGEDTTILEEAQRSELEILEKEHSDRLVAIKKKETDAKKAIQDAYVSTVVDGLGAISNLNELVSGLAISRAEGDQVKQEKIAKRSFNLNKALQLSIAGVQAVQAVQNAFTGALASPIFPINPAYPFIQATIAGVVSAANIAKIASARYKGSASSPGISSSGSAGAGAGSFSISDDTSSAQTQLNPDGTPVGSGGTTQVVVSEIDISNVQNGIEAIETKSTF